MVVRVFAGPLAFVAHNLLSVSLVSTACRAGSWSLDVLTLGCAAVALVGLVTSGRRVGAQAADGQQLLAWTGVLVNTFFVLAVLFEGVPSLVLNPCWS
jgi:hypothetical protein